MTTTQPTTTQPPTSPPARQVRNFALTLTIFGAASSAVVTGVLAAEEASTTGKLIGMALGAAIPPLVGAVGPGHQVRVAVAVLLTIVAVVISYGGWQIFAKVSDTEPVLPTPNDVVRNLVDPDPDPDPRPEDPIVMSDGVHEITITPPSITCEADGFCDTVTVTSTGAEALEVTSLEFDGDVASYLNATGCEAAVLERDRSCTITLQFSPEKAPESVATNLVIHQNLRGPASYVPLEAHGEPSVEPNLALGQPVCDRSGLFPDPDGGVVSGELSIEAPLSATGLADVSSVETAVYVDGVEWQTKDVDPNGGAVSFGGFYEGPPPEEIRVVIDPGNVVLEPDLDNVASCLS